MDPESGILSESVFFEARKATSPSSFPSYYSSRIRQKMRDIESGMSEKDAEIEASKTHWTEVESNGYHTRAATSGREESSTSETSGESSGVSGGESCVMTEEQRAKLYEENVGEMRRLQLENEASNFFQIGGKVAGEMIAKGGQATIYEYRFDGDGESPLVLKVFEAGYSVRDLRTQWPLDMLHRIETGKSPSPGNRILSGRLLDDGRFAFEMFRFWGDVRKMLDVRMEHNGNRYSPFMTEDGSYQDLCIFKLWLLIASGMKRLHEQGTLHRDLKASNALIDSMYFWKDNNLKEENRCNPLEFGMELMCYVADYECSIGVVGTGFWRAPEILEALKHGPFDPFDRSVFTPKVDVYSYAMTCYEIMTGYEPFEHPLDEGINIDKVLQGARPTLPPHLKPWVKEMFERCWHKDPLERPTFPEILKILRDVKRKNPNLDNIWKRFLHNYMISNETRLLPIYKKW